MSTQHVLKTQSVYWHAVERGDKTFEVRKDDRGFQAGDGLALIECDENGRELHNLALVFEVSYVLHGGQFGIEPGYCVLGLRRENQRRKAA